MGWRWRKTKGHLMANVISQRGHGHLGVIDGPKNRLGVIHEGLTSVGQGHTPRMPLQQFDSQFVFELLDLVPQPRLRNSQISACCSKAGAFYDGYKIPYLPDIHSFPRTRLCRRYSLDVQEGTAATCHLAVALDVAPRQRLQLGAMLNFGTVTYALASSPTADRKWFGTRRRVWPGQTSVGMLSS